MHLWVVSLRSEGNLITTMQLNYAKIILNICIQVLSTAVKYYYTKHSLQINVF